ncbi:hypothetical protein BH09BAC1_BH09BAC1_04620 [soil metagenome]
MQKSLLLLLFLILAVFVKAQPGKGGDLGLFKERFPSVKNAVATGLYLVQQQYIAVDSTGKEYGYNNQDNFGIGYSIGIKIKEGLLLPSSFNTPGLYDPNFEPYKNTYHTRTSSIKQRLIDSLKYNDIKLADLQAELPRINQASSPDFFTLKQYKDVKEGKLIVVFAEDVAKLADENAKTNTIQVEDLTWDDKGIAQPKNLILGNRTVLGGVLFYEEVSFGKVAYQPVAFFEQINGAWVLKAIDVKQSPAGLNPIDKKKK